MCAGNQIPKGRKNSSATKENTKGNMYAIRGLKAKQATKLKSDAYHPITPRSKDSPLPTSTRLTATAKVSGQKSPALVKKTGSTPKKSTACTLGSSSGTHSAASYPHHKQAFVTHKKVTPRPTASQSQSLVNKEKAEKGDNSSDPVWQSNSMLLAAGTPSEEHITQKFLLTREVDAHISDVEAEIRQLHLKQSKAKRVIKTALSRAEARAQELLTTQEDLTGIYEASQSMVQDRLREVEVVGQFTASSLQTSIDNDQDQNQEGDVDVSEAAMVSTFIHSVHELHITCLSKLINNFPHMYHTRLFVCLLQQKKKRELRRISVEDLETENTMKKELTYDPASHTDEFQRRDEGYLPCDRTINDPTATLENIIRIDYLWDRFREHAWEVGKKRVFVKKFL
jgi:hypothetical protein